MSMITNINENLSNHCFNFVPRLKCYKNKLMNKIGNMIIVLTAIVLFLISLSLKDVINRQLFSALALILFLLTLKLSSENKRISN